MYDLIHMNILPTYEYLHDLDNFYIVNACADEGTLGYYLTKNRIAKISERKA